MDVRKQADLGKMMTSEGQGGAQGRVLQPGDPSTLPPAAPPATENVLCDKTPGWGPTRHVPASPPLDCAGDSWSPRVAHMITLLGEASEMPAPQLCCHRRCWKTWARTSPRVSHLRPSPSAACAACLPGGLVGWSRLCFASLPSCTASPPTVMAKPLCVTEPCLPSLHVSGHHLVRYSILLSPGQWNGGGGDRLHPQAWLVKSPRVPHTLICLYPQLNVEVGGPLGQHSHCQRSLVSGRRRGQPPAPAGLLRLET